LTESILLLLDVQSTDPENCCQTTHEREVHDMVVFHCVWSAVLYNCPTEEECEGRKCQRIRVM